MEYVALSQATGRVLDGFAVHNNQIALKFRDNTFSVITANDFGIDVTQELNVQDDAQLVQLGLLTEAEAAQRGEKRVREAAENTERHERQLYARLKAKFEPDAGGGKGGGKSP